MVELSGSENRIFVARKDYNKVAAEYNQKLRSFSNRAFCKYDELLKKLKLLKKQKKPRQFLRSILEHLHLANKVNQSMNKGISLA